uniref:Perilipin n=1 Tax=Podarcis muralis TaxID=64176 RepID=A0A670K6D5_PODMU
MSNNEGNGKAESHEVTEKGQQCVIQRLTDLPLVSITCEILSTTYNSAKGSHPAINAVCDMAEVGLKKIASSAVSSAQPVMNKLEPQIISANAYACQGLDKLQETLPVVQQTIEKVKYTLQSLDRQLNPQVANHQKEMEPILVEWNGSIPMPSQSYEESLLEAESQVLSLTYGISQQMRNICQTFLANAQGLPVDLLEKVQQTYSSMEDLQETLSGAKSLKDLPSGSLKESQEKIGEAQETIFETLEYVIVTTLVAGSFFPPQTSMEESEKEAKAEA